MREFEDLQDRLTALTIKNKVLAHHLTTKDGKTHRYDVIVKKLKKNNLIIDSYIRRIEQILSKY